LHFGDRQTNKQTDEQMDSIHALSRSRCREHWLNNRQTPSLKLGYSADRSGSMRPISWRI